MARRKRELDPAVEDLVQEQLRKNEMVLDWNEFRPGELAVRVIDKDLHKQCEELRKICGRGGGKGRTLEFKLEDGQWVFRGAGGWIS